MDVIIEIDDQILGTDEIKIIDYNEESMEMRVKIGNKIYLTKILPINSTNILKYVEHTVYSKHKALIKKENEIKI